MKYYIDTSIWLNLFKKEGDERKGKPYWKIAEEFIRKMSDSNGNRVIYSSIVLRELEINLSRGEYEKRKRELKEETKFMLVDVLQEDGNKARKLESKHEFEISFYDLVHLSICKRLKFILITRDRKLLEICKENNVDARRPEELTS